MTDAAHQTPAFRVNGDSMQPRYRHGECIYVSADDKPLPGDDVVVALKDGRKLLRQFTDNSSGLVHLTPANGMGEPVAIPVEQVVSMQPVSATVRPYSEV